MQTTVKQSFCYKFLFFNIQNLQWLIKDKDRNKKASDSMFSIKSSS